MRDAPMIPLAFERLPEDFMRERADRFHASMAARRSVRVFSPETVPLAVVRTCIHTAAQAPSGANKQPWTFVLVTSPEKKREIRLAAEKEEHAFYHGRAPEAWLQALQPFATDEHKPYLETAPVLVAVFARMHGEEGDKHYYVRESVGIAAGMLLAALHNAGLATLVHTPAPMQFLGDILGRPKHEKPYLLIPVGYPGPDCVVPDIARRPFSETLVEV